MHLQEILVILGSVKHHSEAYMEAHRASWEDVHRAAHHYLSSLATLLELKTILIGSEHMHMQLTGYITVCIDI